MLNGSYHNFIFSYFMNWKRKPTLSSRDEVKWIVKSNLIFSTFSESEAVNELGHFLPSWRPMCFSMNEKKITKSSIQGCLHCIWAVLVFRVSVGSIYHPSYIFINVYLTIGHKFVNEKNVRVVYKWVVSD